MFRIGFVIENLDHLRTNYPTTYASSLFYWSRDILQTSEYLNGKGTFLMARGNAEEVVVVCLLAGKTENSDESLLLHSKTYTAAARRLRWVALALRKNWTSVQIFARCNCSLIEISEFLLYPVGSWKGDAVVEPWAWCVQFEFILNLENITTLLLFILIYLIMAWCWGFMKVICLNNSCDIKY